MGVQVVDGGSGVSERCGGPLAEGPKVPRHCTSQVLF